MSLHRGTLSSLVVLLALLACVAIGAARAGAAGFGNDGRVVTPFGPGDAHGSGVVHTSTGLTIVAGTASNGTNNDFALAAYDQRGRLDAGFGSGGTVRTDLGGDEQVRDVALDAQGRIVVAGYSGFQYTPAVDEALVARYLPDGSLDQSFGEGGVARAGTGGAQAVAIDPTGRIVISGGTSFGPFENPWRVARLTSSGGLDPSFGGGDGEVTGSLYSESNYAEDVVVDPNGRVYFAACGQNAETPPVFAAGRLLADGAVDQSYGEQGLAKIEFPNSYACAHAIAFDQRGRILVAGNGNHRLVAARLRNNGALDDSFAGDGRALLTFRKSEPRLGRIAVDGRNRLVLAGMIEPDFGGGAAYSDRFVLARLRANGRRDTGFAGDGDVAFQFGPRKAKDAEATSIALASGAIYAAGSVHPAPTGTASFALLRYP